MNSSVGRLAIATVSGVIVSSASAQTFEFNDISAIVGLSTFQPNNGIGTGAAAADFDNDGRIDFFVPTTVGFPDQLYHQQSDGNFLNIAASAGVNGTERNVGALWVDYDADDDLDLFVFGDCFRQVGVCIRPNLIKLYEQVSPAQFVDVTSVTGIASLNTITGTSHFGGACAGDVNNDGYPDVVVSYWKGPTHLFLNNGDKTFIDASVSSGLRIVPTSGFWAPVMIDLDGDGWLDIYQAVDFDPNVLWRNNGDGTFTDVAAAAGLDNDMNDMGIAIGDYDGDLDFDFYVTNISDSIPNPGHNVMLRNDSVGSALSFTEVSMTLGVDDGDWGWGTTFFDCDLDGLLDLAATNGYIQPAYANDPSVFFLNTGVAPGYFTEVAASIGFDDTDWGSALLSFDCDGDGDLDTLQTTMGGVLRMLQGNATIVNDNHWIKVIPRMPGTPNTRALGATVQVTTSQGSQIRLITAGISFLGQEPALAHFGVGSDSAVDITVNWPDGTSRTLFNVPTNRAMIVVPGACPGDVNYDQSVDIQDLNAVIGNFGSSGPVGDLNNDQSVDIIDLNTVLGNFGQSC